MLKQTTCFLDERRYFDQRKNKGKYRKGESKAFEEAKICDDAV